MPVTFGCPCGKTLQVKDELAGRRVRCPACDKIATVPAADPGFEVVDDPSPAPAPPPRKPAPVRAQPAKLFDDDDDDRPRSRRDRDDDRPRNRRDRDDEDDDDHRPRSRRGRDDDEDDDRPRKKKKFRKGETETKQHSHFGFEKGIINGGVGVGILAMVGAVVWFVVGELVLNRTFIYPPILFVIGLIATIKGAVSGGSED